MDEIYILAGGAAQEDVSTLIDGVPESLMQYTNAIEFARLTSNADRCDVVPSPGIPRCPAGKTLRSISPSASGSTTGSSGSGAASLPDPFDP